MSILDRLPPGDGHVVALDTETSGLHTDPPGNARLSVVIVSWWADADHDQIETLVAPFDQGLVNKPGLGPRATPLFDTMADAPNLGKDAWDELVEWLSRQWLVCHNAAFDLMILRAGHREWGGGIDLADRLLWDTMVICPLLWPNLPVALKVTAERLWGAQEREPERAIGSWLARKENKVNGDKRYDLAPWDLMEPYARADGELTLQLHEHQTALIEAGEVTPSLVQEEITLTRTLVRMMARGIGFDVERCRAAAEIIRQAREKAIEALPFKPTEAAARKYWFGPTDKGGLGLIPHSDEITARGVPAVRKDIVRRMAENGIPGAQEYETYNQLDTALSMWYDSWPSLTGLDGRLRTVYRQTKSADDTSGGGGKERGTVSGRLAVERVQLQAIPHDYQLPPGVEPVRSMFRADEGWELWEFDLAQAEMRVAAAVSNCTPLLEAFARGEDAHDATCRMVFKIDQDHPDWFRYRQVTKRLNFGMLYGAGARTIQAQIKLYTGIDVSLEQTQEWVALYKQTFPQLSRAARRAQRAAETRHNVRLVTGRQRWFRPMEELHKAMNAVVQGGVSEGAKIWMNRLEAKGQPDVRLLLQIHDSITCELRRETVSTRADEIAGLGEQVFEELFGIPFKVDRKRWDHDYAA